jgi:hypothetical protein
MTRLTRRQMVAAVAGAAPVLAPVAGRAQDASGGDKLESAREQVRKSIGEMEAFELPMTAEPAFIFKP